MNFNQSQGLESTKIEEVKTPEIKIKEGVDFVFEQNPELAQVGTKEQYSEYLDTIFPESKLKDIVYHGSKSKEKFDKFIEDSNSTERQGLFFARTKESSFGDKYGQMIIALLNIKNMEFISLKDRAEFRNIGSPKEILNEAGFDAVEIENNKIGSEINVFDPEQIHILGSRQDVEGFKEFISKNKENVMEKDFEFIENSALNIESKLELSLLLLDRKQGVQIGDYKIVNSQIEKDAVIQEFTQEISNILSLVSELKLQYEIVKELSDDNGMIGFSILVSKNKEILNKFKQADKKHDDKTFGLILGYPPTAVEAYGTDRAFNIERDLPKMELEKLKSEGVLPFLLFMPSKEHWYEELEWARKNKKLIENKAPKLYQELIK